MTDGRTKKIKIIYVTCALEVGGAEKFLLDLLKNLDRSQFEPILATVIGGGSLEKQFRALELPMHVFGRRRIRYLGGLHQCWQLYQLFKKGRPDIVHTQLFAADLWGRIAGRLAGVPLILTTEQNVNIDQSWLREWLKKITYRLVDGTAAISTAVKKYVMKRYAVPANKIVIIPNDVDTEELEKRVAEAQGQKQPGKRIVLTTGRLVLQKGQKYLLDAWALLLNKDDKDLWIAGDGELRRDLEAQAQKLGIAEQVKFLGTRSDVPELLAQADIFAFPSLWEGLGIAVLEAVAAKVPIVASAVDGVLDIIQDGISGRLVPPGDSQKLAQAITWVLEHPVDAKEMAEKAYKHVQETFDIKKIVRKYQDWYLGLLKSNN